MDRAEIKRIVHEIQTQKALMQPAVSPCIVASSCLHADVLNHHRLGPFQPAQEA